MKLFRTNHNQQHNLWQRISQISALVFFSTLSVQAADPLSYNTGSLGTLGDGTHTAAPLLDQPGALATFHDYSVVYGSGSRTTLPILAALNPPASSPFTIEFWAKPSSQDGDDAPVANRTYSGNRTGWVFFQRDQAAGWNFRMYNGNGSAYGWEMEGGTSNHHVWSHVVGVWTGSSALLYVNGVLADDINKPGQNGVYVENSISNPEAILSIGALYNGGSPSQGAVDEIAFYPTALSAGKIANHFAAAANPAADAYSSVVLADGATLHLQQNPPTVKLSLAGGVPKVTFTGVLSQSEKLIDWQQLPVASPYEVPLPAPAKLFFRAER